MWFPWLGLPHPNWKYKDIPASYKFPHWNRENVSKKTTGCWSRNISHRGKKIKIILDEICHCWKTTVEYLEKSLCSWEKAHCIIRNSWRQNGSLINAFLWEKLDLKLLLGVASSWSTLLLYWLQEFRATYRSSQFNLCNVWGIIGNTK